MITINEWEERTANEVTLSNKKYEYFKDLEQENKKLNGAIQTYDILLKANVKENKQLKDLVDTILNFELFVGECPLNFDFGFNSNADKAQKNFCNDEYCEKYCDNNYKKCWLKYFEKLHELERSVKNEK